MRKYGFHLVYIETVEEQVFIEGRIRENNVGDYWIGLTVDSRGQACPDATEEYGESCYYFSPSSTTRPQAFSDCSRRDFHLVYIETAEEQDFIERRMRENNVGDYWIGLTVDSRGQDCSTKTTMATTELMTTTAKPTTQPSTTTATTTTQSTTTKSTTTTMPTTMTALTTTQPTTTKPTTRQSSTTATTTTQPTTTKPMTTTKLSTTTVTTTIITTASPKARQRSNRYKIIAQDKTIMDSAVVKRDPTSTLIECAALCTPTCKEDPTGVQYRGDLAQTINGRTCQAWTFQEPHAHSRTPANYPNAGLDGNFCRNPDNWDTAWCYTTDPETRWELCAVGFLDPRCQETTPIPTTMTVPTTAMQTSAPVTCAACPYDTERHGESCYYFSPSSTTRPQAYSFCSRYGFHLVYIETAEEQDFIAGRMKENNVGDYWIGLTVDSDGQGVWLDGSSLTYDNTENNSYNDGSECFHCSTKTTVATTELVTTTATTTTHQPSTTTVTTTTKPTTTKPTTQPSTTTATTTKQSTTTKSTTTTIPTTITATTTTQPTTTKPTTRQSTTTATTTTQPTTTKPTIPPSTTTVTTTTQPTTTKRTTTTQPSTTAATTTIITTASPKGKWVNIIRALGTID
eukprot:XP_011674145.1 PREDICTED: integumentary mucin C.1-like [Strongylocentrotus purpuratus]